MNEKETDEGCVDFTSIESVDGHLVRQVTLPLADEHEAPKLAAKRSLFGKSTQHQETVSSTELNVVENKRVKRSLDYELPLGINASSESEDNSISDSRATTPTPCEHTPTQEVDYSQESTISELPVSSKEVLALEVVYGGNQSLFVPLASPEFTIGRYDSNDFSILSRYVSSTSHCVLKKTAHDTMELHAMARTCWIGDSGARWKEVKQGTKVALAVGQRFRLIRSPKNTIASPDIASTVTFRLLKSPLSLLSSFNKRFGLAQLPKTVTPSQSEDEDSDCEFVFVERPAVPSTVQPGAASFDNRYKLLLDSIHDNGKGQPNKKGQNVTLRSPVSLEIDLDDSSQDNSGLGKFILPITTLRSMYGARGTIVEAMFYLRGEDNIAFLQKHSCSFWDKQADENGFIGLNYGLLTNYPQEHGKPPINQLETRVISKLVKGEYSRNMTCTLLKPGEPTSQEACTKSVQFTVNTDESGREVLDITVDQRSSDVVLGLPHDVCCWSIILHLVRREVFMRSGRRLAGGKVAFVIAAGGAHVYDINQAVFQELRKREPIVLDESPELIIETDKGMMEMAREFDGSMVRVKGYGSQSHHPALKIQQAL